jgi:hypothetical protein
MLRRNTTNYDIEYNMKIWNTNLNFPSAHVYRNVISPKMYTMNIFSNKCLWTTLNTDSLTIYGDYGVKICTLYHFLIQSNSERDLIGQCEYNESTGSYSLTILWCHWITMHVIMRECILIRRLAPSLSLWRPTILYVTWRTSCNVQYSGSPQRETWSKSN